MTHLNAYMTETPSLPLGGVRSIRINSSLGPFQVLPDYKIPYPPIIIAALGQLYAEYNRAFCKLVQKNREWGTDYQNLFFYGLTKSPVNVAVQIDMLGLPNSFLKVAPTMSLEDVKEVLRASIFEIENSLAMYQLLEKTFAGDSISKFQIRFRHALNELRNRFDKPIALLAVTNDKYKAMLASEFGKKPGELISDEEVKKLSGFDRFFSPEQFRAHVAMRGGQCDYLLYVRSSHPVSKLKNPKVPVDHPLLGDSEMRRIIKAHAITMNIDAPDMKQPNRINDTKEYMGRMSMGFMITSMDQLFTPEFLAFLKKGRGRPLEYEGMRLSETFVAYLTAQGIDVESVNNGTVNLRAKPLKGSYGCYGHVSGSIVGKKFRSEVGRQMRRRGKDAGYVIQVEMETPRVTNIDTGDKFTYIDRNFFAFTNGAPVFLGGFRSLMPVDSHEAMKGRNHGSTRTVWAEIHSS